MTETSAAKQTKTSVLTISSIERIGLPNDMFAAKGLNKTDNFTRSLSSLNQTCEEPIIALLERTYILSELPEGVIGRVLDLPQGDWVYANAEAHFANGLLTVTIPTQARAEYLRQMHAV